MIRFTFVAAGWLIESCNTNDNTEAYRAPEPGEARLQMDTTWPCTLTATVL